MSLGRNVFPFRWTSRGAFLRLCCRESRLTGFSPTRSRAKVVRRCVAKIGIDEAGNDKQFFRQKNKYREFLLNDIAEYVPLLQNPDDFCFVENRGRITALPRTHAEILLTLAQKLRVMSLGIEIGNKKGCDFIPTHALAMSTQLNPDAFCRQEVSYEQAIAYLRGETIALDHLPLGFVLIAYKNEPLGFVKISGTEPIISIRVNGAFGVRIFRKREEPFGMVIEDSTKNPIP